MWKRRLLSRLGEDGSAAFEFVFAALFATLLLFGLIEVAFALYGRNVVMSSAHEAARAAVELGAAGADAETVAEETVARSTGSLVEGYSVDVATQRADDRIVVRVRVSGRLDPPGPLPVSVPVSVNATSIREVQP